MARNATEIERAVARTLRDSLEKLQHNSDDVSQAVADLVSACSSARASNTLPHIMRAQTAAASLAASLDVLSRFITSAIQPGWDVFVQGEAAATAPDTPPAQEIAVESMPAPAAVPEIAPMPEPEPVPVAVAVAPAAPISFESRPPEAEPMAVAVHEVPPAFVPEPLVAEPLVPEPLIPEPVAIQAALEVEAAVAPPQYVSFVEPVAEKPPVVEQHVAAKVEVPWAPAAVVPPAVIEVRAAAPVVPPVPEVSFEPLTVSESNEEPLNIEIAPEPVAAAPTVAVPPPPVVPFPPAAARPPAATMPPAAMPPAAPIPISVAPPAVPLPPPSAAASVIERPAFDLSALPLNEQELHRRASRVAKVSMQDIKMLRPADVRAGKENHDLCQRLRDDIERARKEYERRFHAILDHPVDYFYVWMVEILGEGDPRSLGAYPYPSPALRR